MAQPQRILVVGGASGIGAALIISIIRTSTAQVFCFDKDIDYSSSGPLGTLLSFPNRMYGHEGDVTIPDEREHAIATCIRPDVLGGIDTVVYCAGILTPIQRIENLDMESVEMTYSVNVFGAMAMAQLALPHLRAARIARPLNAGFGKMIFLTSACDQDVTYHGWSPYCSSKAALTRFISCFAHEESGISVQGVYPKLTNTKMPENVVKGKYRGIMADHEVERFKTWGKMGEEMIEPPEWCGEAVAKLVLGFV
ncbi:hypothetical protein SNOG_08504 [Parastagonospora nodorum SN15]|uniref:Uncharacterized protein n=1 Tax=Phaeosphaeria nodorum (strain SN15 / ATCC MYA-4574 / FGSC 10173) TaxID=321614 RepID=Q0UIB0_PHANO|nr:hypothetical protein SNOG_08504 [Parastagonospora nodorum SN15]EAT83672.1 hypothetical protein SNOG_08504 [Parastagonospora nodorum SN15]